MTDIDPATFADLVARLRAGDEAAAAELVRYYEPEVRREVRLRMRGPAMRRLIDSVDISQSVLGAFFLRAALGELELDHPRKVLRLLITMAQNRLTDWARRLRADRRDKRKDRDIEGVPADSPALHDKIATPSALASAAELLLEVKKRMTEEELAISDGRAKGLSWQEIGQQVGKDAHAVRKRLVRARDRVSRELGLDP